MKKFYRLRFLLLGGQILCLFSILTAVFVLERGKELRVFASLGGAVLLVFSIALFYAHDRYLRSVIIQLSELIATITELKERQIFPESEDTLLSKLQNQVIKLTGILQAQNRAVDKEKNDIKSLISDISHQLKTPVATLKMYGEFLLDEQSTEEERQEYLGIMEEALEKLDFLTENMIKMSRLEGGIIRLQPESAVLNETLLSAIMQAHQKARGKDIEITLDERSGQVEVRHDIRWTGEAIFNVIDNAIKYSPTGSRVHISLEKYETYARVDIRDEGIGIPETEHAKIFQRFYRGMRALEEEGAGIGLFLSRKILMDQDGYIKVKSSGQGTTFSLFLRAV